MTLVAGRVTRSVSASEAAASRSTAGPRTMAYSSGASASVALSSSRFATTLDADPVTVVNSSALADWLSTMIGIQITGTCWRR